MSHKVMLLKNKNIDAEGAAIFVNYELILGSSTRDLSVAEILRRAELLASGYGSDLITIEVDSKLWDDYAALIAALKSEDYIKLLGLKLSNSESDYGLESGDIIDGMKNGALILSLDQQLLFHDKDGLQVATCNL